MKQPSKALTTMENEGYMKAQTHSLHSLNNLGRHTLVNQYQIFGIKRQSLIKILKHYPTSVQSKSSILTPDNFDNWINISTLFLLQIYTKHSNANVY